MIRSSSGPPVRALFRVAAGTRIGFGHLVRARVLSQALGLNAASIAVRGGSLASRTAQALGFDVLTPEPASAALRRLRPDVLIIDDPSAAAAREWRAAASRQQVPVVAVHDLGTACCGADLAVDGSVVRLDADRHAARELTGLRYAILDPSLRRTRARRIDGRVLIALGGGPRRSIARGLALALHRARPSLEIRVAGGFHPLSAERESGIVWLPAQRGLAAELSRCQVAVTGGGVSLYEAVTLGTPVVGWPVVRAQHPTVAGFARRGLAHAVLPGPGRLARAVSAVCSLTTRRATTPAAARRAGLDGRGAERVAAAIERLVRARTAR